jgi:hypothetical protein
MIHPIQELFGQTLRGSIAHIAIWNRLLSRAEIDLLWTAGQSELRDTPMYHSYV